MKAIKISNKLIGEDKPCFIIAEAGVNHILGSDDLDKIGISSHIEVAFKLVDAAKEAGVDAVKFQSFNAGSLQYKGTHKPQYQIDNIGEDDEINYFDMLKKLETSREDQIRIAKYCKKKEIIFLSTPYDKESVDFLDEEVKVPLFKLASIELNNHLFTKYVANKGKTILLSTGLSTIDDVRSAVELARKEGYLKRLILLQCTSDYPAKHEEINLNVLKTYMKEFPDILFGFSDHSSTNTASIGAVALGVVVVEKHFTLDKSFKGPDHSASFDTDELKQWVVCIKEIEKCRGSYDKMITESEKKNLTMRKYLMITPQTKGTIVTEDMLIAMRSGKGVLPIEKSLKKIIGKKLKRIIKEISPFDWGMIE